MVEFLPTQRSGMGNRQHLHLFNCILRTWRRIYMFYNAGNVCLHRKELHKETIWHLSSKNCCASLKMLFLLFKAFHGLFLYIFKSLFPLACAQATWENQRIRRLILAGPDMVCRAQEMIRHAWAWLCFLEVWNMGLGDKQKGSLSTTLKPEDSLESRHRSWTHIHSLIHSSALFM